MTLASIVKTMRLPFLVLTPVCVFLGVSIVVASQHSVDFILLFMALLGALLAHISVNMLNEYYDFKSGLDLTTQRTDFSGGSGALPENPEAADRVFYIGVLTLIATVSIGIFFIYRHGWGILPLGLLGLIIIVAYTEWINRHPFICLVAPGLGFGFLMVVGTQFVLEGEYRSLSWAVAFIPFFLVNNLLLLNQYPDIEADARVGRKHFPITYGIKGSNIVYGVSVLATMIVVVILVISNQLPTMSLLTLIPVLLSFFSLYGAIKYGEKIGNHPQYLGANVVVSILTPLVLGITLWLSV